MNANLEPGRGQFVPELLCAGVFAFRNEVERGSETESLFHFVEWPDPVTTGPPLDIMREDQREFFAIRPTWPAFRRNSCALFDWPYALIVFDAPPNPPPPHRQPH